MGRMNKHSKRFLYMTLRAFSVLFAAINFYWAFINEVWVWGKDIYTAIVVANFNWVMLVFSIFLFIISSYEISKTLERNIVVVQKPVKNKSTKLEKTTTQKKPTVLKRKSTKLGEEPEELEEEPIEPPIEEPVDSKPKKDKKKKKKKKEKKPKKPEDQRLPLY